MCENVTDNAPKTVVSVYVRVKPPLSFTASATRRSFQDSSKESCIKYDDTSVSVEHKTQKATGDVSRTVCMLPNCHGVMDGSTRDLFEAAKVPSRYLDDCMYLGKSGIICCYGQSSSGKTYTMFGGNSGGDHEKGLVHLAIEYLLSATESKGHKISVMAFEIYEERVIDLISSSRKENKGTKQHVSDGVECNRVPVHSTNDFDALVKRIESRRSMCSTGLNQSSSRSHGFLRISLESPSDCPPSITSSLTFVDLAGSERQSKSKASGNTLKEGIMINKSLMTLGAVVRSLSHQREGHIPWRESKLTTVLRPFLQRDANVGFVLCISSEESCSTESVSTLRFGAMLLDMRLRESVAQDLLSCSPQTPCVQSQISCSAIEKDDRLDSIIHYEGFGYLFWHVVDFLVCLLLGSAHMLLLLLFWKFL